MIAFSFHQADHRPVSAFADQGIPVSVAIALIDHVWLSTDLHTIGQFSPLFGRPIAATQELLPARSAAPDLDIDG